MKEISSIQKGKFIDVNVHSSKVNRSKVFGLTSSQPTPNRRIVDSVPQSSSQPVKRGKELMAWLLLG